jgi:hypothetical protein
MMKIFVIFSARSAHEVVVLQLYTRVSFAIVFDDVAYRSKMPREMSIVHGASKCPS